MLAHDVYALRGGVPKELGMWTRRMGATGAASRASAESTLKGAALFRGPAVAALLRLDELLASSLAEQLAWYYDADTFLFVVLLLSTDACRPSGNNMTSQHARKQTKHGLTQWAAGVKRYV